jgi:magnesium chelatase family protein
VVARAFTHALVGLEPRRVEVEAHLQSGTPSFAIVGLADRACQEAKHRVRSGIASASLYWPPDKRITVNLAPAALRKEGTGFDLSIALAVLAASHQLPAERLGDHSVVGELALDGRIRPVAGAIAFAEGARRQEPRRVLCAAEAERGVDGGLRSAVIRQMRLGLILEVGGGSRFRVIFASAYMGHRYPEEMRQAFGTTVPPERLAGSSFWFEIMPHQ